ncbi:MAG: stage 0 sporulation family protein [Oscillospiraceae bacterium]
MAEIIGVRFKSVGKIYYFAPNGEKIENGAKVIVETARGVECGTVVMPNREVPDSELSAPLKPVIRIATEKDLETVEQNKKKEKEAFSICEEKIAKHKLDMKLVDVECTFDNNKLLFYFTAENRVDFRELVKDLASVFRTRIELRQIGVRDEAKMLGGLGICGRPFCCNGFLGEFQPVSIKMAKEQGLSLNPTKISGTCSRLMCCLKYEQESYEDLIRTTPKVNAYVSTPNGNGYVEEVNLITGKLKVKPENSDGASFIIHKSEVSIIKDGEIRLSKDEIRALKGLEDK